MLPNDHSTQLSDQSGFNVPKKRKRGKVEMCMPCRQSKRKVGCQPLRLRSLTTLMPKQCSYSDNNTWPKACLSCAAKRRECSAPQLKGRSKRLTTSHSGRQDGTLQALVLPSKPIISSLGCAHAAPSSSAFEDIADFSCKRALVLPCHSQYTYD